MRPSAETRPAANGSLTLATCSMPATLARADSTPARKLVSCSPAGAANTATAVPPAAAGNRSSRSVIAWALSLFGAVKSSRNAPPKLPARATTTAAITVQAPIVVHGLRALVSPMRWMTRFTLRDPFGAAALVWSRRSRSWRFPSGSEESSGLGGAFVDWSASTWQDGDQRQAEVADLLEQAVQRGLVDDRAVEDGGAVGLVAEAQPVEPGGPAVVEVAREADLVLPRLVPAACRCLGVVHEAERRSGCGELGSPHLVIQVVISRRERPPTSGGWQTRARSLKMRGRDAPSAAWLRPAGSGRGPRARGATPPRVGWGFIALYALAYMSTCLLFLAPLLVTLALKINSLVGIDRAPNSLALVAGVGALLAMFANPFFGKLSDRTSSRFGMRRPWMVTGLVGGSLGILVVALAPNIAVVLVGWCMAQLFFNALLAVQVAVLPDQVPTAQRGMVAGILGVCVPVASVVGTFVVKVVNGNQVAMFLAPCAIAGFFILLFAVRLERSPAGQRGQAAPGRCGSSCARSTSTRARARTSPGPSSAGSCSSWPTRS